MNIWSAIYRISCAVLAITVILALVEVFLPKFRENENRQKRVAVLEEEIREKDEMTRDLRNRQERFKTDPTYVERVAREELGKARPDEVIIRVADPKTNQFR